MVILELVGRAKCSHESGLVCTGTGDSSACCRSRSWNSDRSAGRGDRDCRRHIRTDHWHSGRSTWYSDCGLCIRSRLHGIWSGDVVYKAVSWTSVTWNWMYRNFRWNFYDVSVHMALSDRTSGSCAYGRKSLS